MRCAPFTWSQCCTTRKDHPEQISSDFGFQFQIFSYGELKVATEHFASSRILGEGSFGKVYHGQLQDGRQIAVKLFHENKRVQQFMRFFRENEHKRVQQFMNEIEVLSQLSHQNLVPFYGYCHHGHQLMLVYQYVSNGSLAANLQGEIRHCSTLRWLNRLDIAIDTANALSYLHYHGIIHGNIKPSNILLDENFCAKIASLHLSRKLSEGVFVDAAHVTSDVMGTCDYIDPEYVSHGKLSAKNDVYSFGVVLCELISSKLGKYWEGCNKESIATLLSRKIENQALDEVSDQRLGFQSDHKIKQMITATAELALWCMQCPQELRPNMEQVLETLHGIRQERYESLKAFRIFYHAELVEATNHFKTCLGEGGFGMVYYGKLEDGREIAVKRFHDKKDKYIKQFMKEVEILRLLHHKNLVSLYGCSSRNSNECSLVYEYISNGTLSKHLHEPSCGKLPWLTRLNIAIETATALAYLHDSGVIHRDVKASNILLDENFAVKVADFGLSRSLPNCVSHASTIAVGTRGYIDPEYLQLGKVSYRSDVYSFGVVLFELISSKRASWFEGTKLVILANFAVSKLLNKALDELVDPSLGSDSDENVMKMIRVVIELAFQCVHHCREFRPSMKQALETLEGIKKGTWGFNQMTQSIHLIHELTISRKCLN